MKKNIYSFTVIVSIIILIVNIFIKSSKLTDIIIFSINLFIRNIFPSLFPMFIISSLLIELDIPLLLSNIFKKPMNTLFGVNGSASFIFFMSMLTGFPSNAKYIDDLITKNILDDSSAQQILLFTFFSNPLFVINTIGNYFFNDIKIGLCIYISHVLGNVVTGFILRKKHLKEIVHLESNKDIVNGIGNKINDSNIFEIITNSISSSLTVMINIFGIITFFLIIINIFFTSYDSIIKVIITGVIEMTTGLKYLSVFRISVKVKIIISTFFISFGGLSIHAQIMNSLKKRKIKYLPFLISRIIHSFVSSLIVYIIV